MNILLSSRTLIELSGSDIYSFLHGLMTNDIYALTNQPHAIYAAFLTPKGRFISDAYIVKKSETTVYLDVDISAVDILIKTFHLLRLRSDVRIDTCDARVYACFTEPSPDTSYIRDPRHTEMGFRLYSKMPPLGTTDDRSSYDVRRIQFTLADGTLDIPLEKGLIMEYGFDRINGVDFKKGCYVGQELTTQMFHKKMNKYQLKTLMFNEGALLSHGQHIYQNDVDIGALCSHQGRYALARVNTEYARLDHPVQCIQGSEHFSATFYASEA